MTTVTDYQSASEGYAELEAALAGSASGEERKWGKVAGMGQLMKQVSVINAALKRGLQPARLKSQAKNTTGQTATLAAIANQLLFDTHEVKNEADLPSWYEYCRRVSRLGRRTQRRHQDRRNRESQPGAQAHEHKLRHLSQEVPSVRAAGNRASMSDRRRHSLPCLRPSRQDGSIRRVSSASSMRKRRARIHVSIRTRRNAVRSSE